MAKKRRKDREEAEEEYEFTPPEFDEKEFLLKEIFDTRVVMFTVLFGVIFGVVAGLITITDNSLAGVAFLVVVVGMIALRWLYLLVKIDTTKFLKKNWLGNIGTFFFTFLAIWILLINQPFADFAHPTVTNATIWVANPGNVTAIDYKFNKALGTNTWSERFGFSVGTVIHSNSTLNITARVADSDGLRSVTISIPNMPIANMTRESAGISRWGYVVNASSFISGPTGSLSFIITAIDEKGNQELFQPAVLSWTV